MFAVCINARRPYTVAASTSTQESQKIEIINKKLFFAKTTISPNDWGIGIIHTLTVSIVLVYKYTMLNIIPGGMKWKIEPPVKNGKILEYSLMAATPKEASQLFVTGKLQ